MPHNFTLLFGLLTTLAIAGCVDAQGAAVSPDREERKEQEQPPWQGLWTGRSAIAETIIDDPIRKVSRKSEADFWFVVEGNGSIHGEGYIAYSAEMKAVKFKIPLPKEASIDAEVAGSAPKQYFRFGIAGEVIDKESGRPYAEVLAEGRANNVDEESLHKRPIQLHLVATGEDEEGEAAAEENGTIPGIKFQFSIDAMVSVPAGVGGKAATAALPGAMPKLISIPIDAKGWSPFQGATPDAVAKGNEPYRVLVESKGEKHTLFWFAYQQTQPMATPPNTE